MTSEPTDPYALHYVANAPRRGLLHKLALACAIIYGAWGGPALGHNSLAIWQNGAGSGGVWHLQVRNQELLRAASRQCGLANKICLAGLVADVAQGVAIGKGYWQRRYRGRHSLGNIFEAYIAGAESFKGLNSAGSNVRHGKWRKVSDPLEKLRLRFVGKGRTQNELDAQINIKGWAVPRVFDGQFDVGDNFGNYILEKARVIRYERPA